MAKLNLDDAARFLESFEHQQITLQWKHPITKRNKVEVITPITIKADLESFCPQYKDWDWYFMVNCGDGVIHAPHTTPRSKDSVQSFDNVFIESDGVPLSEIHSFLKLIDIRPHWVIYTSGNKEKPHLHLHFRIESEPKTPQNIIKYKGVQTAFAYLGKDELHPDMDKGAWKDISRVLRIPGFIHATKGNLVKIHTENSFNPYSLNQLFEACNAQKYLDREKEKKEEPFIAPTVIKDGNRHNTIRDLAARGSQFAPSRGDLWLYVKGALSITEKGEEFEKEAEGLINSAWETRGVVKAQEANKAATKLITETKDPFALPDDFYYQAPGLIGPIVKEISTKAHYPCPPLAFIQTLAATGTLRSKKYVSPSGLPPVNYFLGLAPTGTGKDYAQKVIKKTFHKLELSRLISMGVRSHLGMLRTLEANQGIGFLSLDEAENLLGLIQDKNAPSYMQQIKPYLLQLYTSSQVEFRSGLTADKKVKEVVIDKPHLNLIAYGTLGVLDTVLTPKTLSDGLLSRFIIVTHDNRTRNRLSVPEISLNSHIYEALDQSAINARSLLNATTTMWEPTLEPISLTSEATKNLEAFGDDLDTQYNKEKESGSGLEGIWVRGYEQLQRLLTATPKYPGEQYTSNDVDFYATFLKSRINAIKEICLKNIFASQADKEQNKVLDFIARSTNAFSDGKIPKRHISKNGPYREKKKLELILESLVEQGRLETETFRQGNRNSLKYLLTLES